METERERWIKAWQSRLKLVAHDIKREAELERRLTVRDDITPFIIAVEEWDAMASDLIAFAERLR